MGLSEWELAVLWSFVSGISCVGGSVPALHGGKDLVFHLGVGITGICGCCLEIREVVSET